MQIPQAELPSCSTMYHGSQRILYALVAAPVDAPLGQKYLISLYWAVTTATTGVDCVRLGEGGGKGGQRPGCVWVLHVWTLFNTAHKARSMLPSGAAECAGACRTDPRAHLSTVRLGHHRTQSYHRLSHNASRTLLLHRSRLWRHHSPHYARAYCGRVCDGQRCHSGRCRRTAPVCPLLVLPAWFN